MSFYNHPFFQQQHQRRGHPAFVAPPAVPAPAFNFFTSPPVPTPTHPSYGHPFASPATDYEAEERAALAHLQAIQHRRRLAEAAELEREHRIRQREYEAEVTRQRHEAIQRQREAEVRVLIEREVQKQRERAILVERQRAQAAHEMEREQARRQAYFEAVQRVREEKNAQVIQAERKRCAERFAGRCARRAEKKGENGAEDLHLHKFLEMLGLDLSTQKVQAEKPKVDENRVETPKPTASSEPTQAVPDNLNALLNHYLGLNVVPVTDEVPSIPSDNNVPQGLNEFLSRFGLEFQPLDVDQEIKGDTPEKKEEKKAENAATAVVDLAVAPTTATTPVTAPVVAPPAGPSTCNKKVPYEFNDFLSRFGCEIDAPTFDKFFQGGANNTKPQEPVAASSTAESSKKASTDDQAEAPLTSYLNQVADLPPFVRDILSNVELAFTESAKKSNNQAQSDTTFEGKGKGVAPGEKSTATKPATPASKPEFTPISKLNDIAHDLYLTTESFTFPPTLSFSTQPSTTTPQLLFNKTNSSYHAQAHKLLQLLLAADGISSGGDKEVRTKRKEIVKRVEGAIEELERQRDEIWNKISEGELPHMEVSDSRSSSETSSVVGDREEIEHVEHAEAATQAEGFEVPVTSEVQTTTAAKNPPETVDHVSAEDVQVDDSEAPVIRSDNVTPAAQKDQEERKEDKEDDKRSVTVEDAPDKEDGYELL